MNDAAPAAASGGGAGRTPGVRLFLCGDVMTGRGIDQVLPHPGQAHLFEGWARSALDYVELAERVSGPIGRGLDPAYPWGEALRVLERMRPHARILNLETAVTASEDAQAGKGIHYRMHPANLPCLTRAAPDCCVLANNHVLDWGQAGLAETLASLAHAGLRAAGAGRNACEAAAPAAIALPMGGRVLVFAYGAASSGVPRGWAATDRRAGVNFLERLSRDAAEAICTQTAQRRRPGDLVVVSLHWGGNWGFEIPDEELAFAHALVDGGGADIVYGHSSHHAKGIEVRGGKLILYGCGDFLNDYEGIGGYGEYRPDLSLMYFPEFDSSSASLRSLQAVPMRIRRFRLERAPQDGVAWLRETLDREGRALGTRVAADGEGTLSLYWQGAAHG